MAYHNVDTNNISTAYTVFISKLVISECCFSQIALVTTSKIIVGRPKWGEVSLWGIYTPPPKKSGSPLEVCSLVVNYEKHCTYATMLRNPIDLKIIMPLFFNPQRMRRGL